MQASTSQGRSYQGYPYVNPAVIDAPSIDAATAARWANLPRKQIHMPARSENQPVVYINVPEDGPGTSAVVEEVETHRNQTKKNIDETPVVYIDLPENSDNDVTERRDEEAEENEPEYVQETIFYDPFENRRINSKAEESDTASDVSSVRSIRAPPNRLTRPTELNLNTSDASRTHCSPSTSTGVPSISSITPMSPNIMSKETLIYGGRQVEDFSVSPIPLSSFPEPPPAYTEIDLPSPNQQARDRFGQEEAAHTSPPRTQVITPMNQNNNATTQRSPQMDHQIPIGVPNLDRKYMYCRYCGTRVHTLVVKEVGLITHVIAFICLIICMLPIVILIYTMKWLKYTNHYCPNCNKKLACVPPIFNDEIVYIN